MTAPRTAASALCAWVCAASAVRTEAMCTNVPGLAAGFGNRPRIRISLIYTVTESPMRWTSLVFYARRGHHRKWANNKFETRYVLDDVKYDALHPWKGKGFF